ncbi:MAG: FtsX-like permease family protein [Phycisphaerales bacterium]|nr:FtsX-like permease family protein [Phycisphaerales bacterium]
MHRLRSTLTALGIVFGVCSVVAMLAIGEGAGRDAQDQIARLGAQNIIIKSIKPPRSDSAKTGTNRYEAYGLSYADVRRIRDTVPHIQEVVPKRLITLQATYRNRSVTVQVIGTASWYGEVHPMRLLRGRFLAYMDEKRQQKAAIVDQQVVDQLFAVDDPIDTNIKLKGDYFTVVGLVAPSGAAGPAGQDAARLKTGGRAGDAAVGNIYVPLSTFKTCFEGSRERVELEELTIKVDSTESVLLIRDALEVLLRRFHKNKDYQIIVPLELLRQAARTKRIFNIVLGSIAAISLLVGGIGIMNIMLATVSERTREIGIRRALGARRSDIIIQFLSETLLLTLTGGLLGIALGLIVPIMVTHFGDMPTVITGQSLIMAFGISAAIGITFGLYPAYRAAHMDPIESLRHE